MHEGMQYDPLHGQGHEPFRVGNPAQYRNLVGLEIFDICPDFTVT